MPRRIALLRGVNVGGKLVAMAALRELVTSIGAHDVRSLLNSGNLVLGSDLEEAELEALLERETQKRLGLATRFFIRGSAEWERLIAANPFADAAKDDPAHLVAVVLREAPKAKAGKALQDAILGRETAQIVGRTAYIVYPDGIGRSKVTLPLIEKKLGTIGTARNWNTVLKLAALIRD